MGRLGGAEDFSASWMTENAQIADDTGHVVGHVKWFDATKGFGFVIAESGGPDILLHSNVLRNYGQGSVADQSRIELRVQETARGLQATEILSLEPPADGSETHIIGVDTSGLEDIELTPARVKWFDKAKGFGFANAFGDREDVFLHIEVLRRCGLADLQTGEAISVRIVEGDRGQMAAEVHSWDYAASSSYS